MDNKVYYDKKNILKSSKKIFESSLNLYASKVKPEKPSGTFEEKNEFDIDALNDKLLDV